jgi:hypothetical protein
VQSLSSTMILSLNLLILLVFCTPADGRHTTPRWEAEEWISSNCSYSNVCAPPPTVNMINPADNMNIWVTQRSPTTQLISFSPDRLAIAIPELEATTAEAFGGRKYVRRTNQFVIQQRMCRLFRGGKAETCYLEPFSTDGMPPATEQAHALFRKAGMSGFSGKGLQIMIATLLAEFNEPAGAFTIQDVLQLFGFDGNRTAENACNNHRAVPVATALPLVAAAHPEAQVLWENLIYNDAEHAESVLGVPPGSCRWMPQITAAPFIQARVEDLLLFTHLIVEVSVFIYLGGHAMA